MRLHQSFLENGTYYDQFLSVILDVDWTLREERYSPARVS